MRVLGIMERDGIAVDIPYLEDLQSTFTAEANAAASSPTRRSVARSTSARPSSCRWCCSTSCTCRRPSARRPGTRRTPTPRRVARADAAPVPQPTCCGTGTSPAQDDGGGPAQVGQRRRPHPHHLPADRRGHGPAVQHRTEPAEHPDPHRRGPADPPRIRPRGRTPSLLLTADYSQIEMRIMADAVRGRRTDRGLPLGRGPAHLRGRCGRSGAPAPGGDPGDAPKDQGHVVRARVRAVGVRPLRTAEDLGGRGARADGGVLRAVRRGAGLPAAHGRPGAPGRLHGDVSGAAGTCPTSPATTGRSGRWPSGSL